MRQKRKVGELKGGADSEKQDKSVMDKAKGITMPLASVMSFPAMERIKFIFTRKERCGRINSGFFIRLSQTCEKRSVHSNCSPFSR